MLGQLLSVELWKQVEAAQRAITFYQNGMSSSNTFGLALMSIISAAGNDSLTAFSNSPAL
jgi:hypothetical protein